MLLQGIFKAVFAVQGPVSEEEEELLPEANQEDADEDLIIGDIINQNMEFKVHLNEKLPHSDPFLIHDIFR